MDGINAPVVKNVRKAGGLACYSRTSSLPGRGPLSMLIGLLMPLEEEEEEEEEDEGGDSRRKEKESVTCTLVERGRHCRRREIRVQCIL